MCACVFVCGRSYRFNTYSNRYECYYCPCCTYRSFALLTQWKRFPPSELFSHLFTDEWAHTHTHRPNETDSYVHTLTFTLTHAHTYTFNGVSLFHIQNISSSVGLSVKIVKTAQNPKLTRRNILHTYIDMVSKKSTVHGWQIMDFFI